MEFSTVAGQGVAFRPPASLVSTIHVEPVVGDDGVEDVQLQILLINSLAVWYATVAEFQGAI